MGLNWLQQIMWQFNALQIIIKSSEKYSTFSESFCETLWSDYNHFFGSLSFWNFGNRLSSRQVETWKTSKVIWT